MPAVLNPIGGRAGLASFSGAAVFNSAVQNVVTTTDVLLTFNSEAYDTDAYHSTSSNTSRLTAPVAGFYQIALSVSWSVNATGIRYLQIRKNAAGSGAGGTTLTLMTHMPSTGLFGTLHQAFVMVQLAAGDYVEAFAYQNSGVTLTVDTNGTFCFSMFKFGGIGGGRALGAMVYNSANQTIPHATNTAITYNSEHSDDAGFHSTSVNTSRLTAPVAGLYAITAGAEFVASSNGHRYIKIRKNGATEYALSSQKGVATYSSAIQVTAYLTLAAGDYVEAVVYHDNGVTLDVIGAVYNTFQISLLSGTPQPTFSGASVYNSGNQSIPNGVYTALTFDSEYHDTASYHSTSSNTSRLVAPVSGYYLIRAAVSFAAHATGTRYMRLRKNGVTEYTLVYRVSAGATDETFLQETLTIQLAAGDYMEALVFQNSGGALNAIGSSGTLTYPFQMTLSGF